MTGIIRKVAIVLLGAVLATGAAFGTAAAIGATAGHKADSRGNGDPKAPTTVTFEEQEYSIVTPEGWTRKDITKDADGKKAIRYEHSDGRYFIVAIDPLGSGYSYDTLWTYKVKGLGFEITQRHNCAGTVDEPCDKDGRFSGYIMWKSGTTPEKVAGHVYYFMFGSSRSETVDIAVFGQILGSITVNA